MSLSPELARAYHAKVIRGVVRMLCCGLVHGDLSEFNVLVDADGPVIIDLPQAVSATANNSAKMMLLRDVENMRAYFGQYAPELLATDYDHEMWALFERGLLAPDSALTGHFDHPTEAADVDELIQVIEHARLEEMERQERAILEFH